MRSKVIFLFVILQNRKVEQSRPNGWQSACDVPEEIKLSIYVKLMRTRIYDEVRAKSTGGRLILVLLSDLADTSYSGRRKRDSPRKAITPLNIHKFITSRVGRIHSLLSPSLLTLSSFTSLVSLPSRFSNTQVAFSKQIQFHRAQWNIFAYVANELLNLI